MCTPRPAPPASPQLKAWCYYESRLLGAHHGLISSYALEVLVLYIFNLHHAELHTPLDVSSAGCQGDQAAAQRQPQFVLCLCVDGQCCGDGRRAFWLAAADGTRFDLGYVCRCCAASCRCWAPSTGSTSAWHCKAHFRWPSCTPTLMVRHNFFGKPTCKGTCGFSRVAWQIVSLCLSAFVCSCIAASTF